MEHNRSTAISEQDVPDALPITTQHISSNEMSCFDCIECRNCPYNHCQPSGFRSPDSSATEGNELPAFQNQICESQPIGDEEKTSVSISMPNSPLEDGSKNMQDTTAPSNTPVPRKKQVRFHSEGLPDGCVLEEPIKTPDHPRRASMEGWKDKGYDSFKTWSGKLEREISNLRGRPREPSEEDSAGVKAGKEALPVHRYYDALEGPELETLRSSEEILLPEDRTWPFLLRYPITSFGICLGVSSQAIMWKELATSASTKFLPISLHVNLVLWCISVALVVIVATIYLLKMILFFEAVRCEYYHPVRVNFFFAPWIVLLFLAIGVPPSFADCLHGVLWYILMIPILCLELKIYGQWISGGERRLSKVANPTNHLSIVGNFVGALLGASMGEKEGPIFFFAIGLAHYTVLFVTLYQRLPTNESLPKELHPVFFLFVATPSVASVAWSKIQGSFDLGSRIAYFIALFLYFSLAVRLNFFRGFKFSLAWWAYTFPTTSAAVATIKYSTEVRSFVTQALAVILSTISTLTVSVMLLSTIIHAFVLRDLFPNDIAIAISNQKAKHHHHHHHHHHDHDHDHDHDHHHHHHMKWFPHAPLCCSKSVHL